MIRIHERVNAREMNVYTYYVYNCCWIVKIVSERERQSATICNKRVQRRYQSMMVTSKSVLQVYQKAGISFLLALVASFVCVHPYNPGRLLLCSVVFRHANQVFWPRIRHLSLVYLRGHCVHFAEPHTQGDHHAAWPQSLVKISAKSVSERFLERQFRSQVGIHCLL